MRKPKTLTELIEGLTWFNDIEKTKEILRKLVAGTSGGKTYLEEGTNITLVGEGTEEDPIIISSTGGGSGSTDYISNVEVSGQTMTFTGVGNAFNGNVTLPNGGGGTGAVDSVFGRTGAVTAQTGDYTVGQVTNAQETLVSGTNIKTVNGETLLGSGDVSAQLPLEVYSESGTLAGGDAEAIIGDFDFAANPTGSGIVWTDEYVFIITDNFSINTPEFFLGNYGQNFSMTVSDIFEDDENSYHKTYQIQINPDNDNGDYVYFHRDINDEISSNSSFIMSENAFRLERQIDSGEGLYNLQYNLIYPTPEPETEVYDVNYPAKSGTIALLPTAKGTAGQFLQTDGDDNVVWATPSGGSGGSTNLGYTTSSTQGTVTSSTGTSATLPLFSTGVAGLVPARVGTVTTKYLREDGTWVTPTNTTYTAGTGILITGNVISATGGGGAVWGSITGTLSNQTDLVSALNGKENSFSKNTGFNKNFGTASGTVAQGNDSRINNGQAAFDSITSLLPIETSNTNSTIALTTSGGNLCNMGSANTNTTYTTTGSVLNAYAKVLINTVTEPTVTGATKIKGATFIASTNMYMVVNYNGVRVEYYFLEI